VVSLVDAVADAEEQTGNGDVDTWTPPAAVSTVVSAEVRDGAAGSETEEETRLRLLRERELQLRSEQAYRRAQVVLLSQLRGFQDTEIDVDEQLARTPPANFPIRRMPQPELVQSSVCQNPAHVRARSVRLGISDRTREPGVVTARIDFVLDSTVPVWIFVAFRGSCEPCGDGLDRSGAETRNGDAWWFPATVGSFFGRVWSFSLVDCAWTDREVACFSGRISFGISGMVSLD